MLFKETTRRYLSFRRASQCSVILCDDVLHWNYDVDDEAGMLYFVSDSPRPKDAYRDELGDERGAAMSVVEM